MNDQQNRPEIRLQPMGLFHTPKSLSSLVEYIESLGQNAHIGWTVYGLFTNLIIDRLSSGEDIYDKENVDELMQEIYDRDSEEL